jgi:hypothetical protein
VHLSCKISNAVLTLLENLGEDLTPLYETVPTSIELLRDSSYWVSAHEMELFLDAVMRMPLRSETSILVQAGHRGSELRSWGVLDSVLRMMPQPQEVFNQPEQFLSYFISPKPPIENFKRAESFVQFDLPLPADQYPHVTTYLKAAFESLPSYIGQELAQCEWTNITLSLQWKNQQNSIFVEDPGRQVSPELFKDLINDLQKTQRDREDLQKYASDLESKVKELEERLLDFASAGDTSQEVPSPSPESNFQSNSPQFYLGQNLARLHDYMVRAQQLITMIQSTGKLNPAVKEAMRRVDWDYVKDQYPRTVSQSMDLLRKIQQKPSVAAAEHHDEGKFNV